MATPQPHPRPIRTQSLVYDEEREQSVILPVDGWRTGSPCWVITPSTTDPEPIGYRLTHVPTGRAIGSVFAADAYTLADLSLLACELDDLLDWHHVQDAYDLDQEEYIQVTRALAHFLRQRSVVTS